MNYIKLILISYNYIKFQRLIQGHYQNQMELIQLANKIFKPKKIQCAQGFDADMPFDPVAMGTEFEDQFQASKGKLPQVPPFEHLLNSVITVTGRVDFIKGFKFDIAMGLSEYFNFSASWSIPNSGTEKDKNPFNSMMSTPQKATFTYTAQLVRDVTNPMTHPGLILLGKADNEGKVQAIALKKLTDNIMLRFNGSFQNSNMEMGVMGLDVDITGKNYSSVIRIMPGHYGFNMMQRVHRNLMLGFDYTLMTMPKISLFSYGAKAFWGSHAIYAQYIAIQDQLNLAYTIPIKKGTQFVSQWRYDRKIPKTTAILGFKQKYEASQILATVNSRGKIASILTLRTMGLSCKLCGLADFQNDKYTFGYGISFGQ